MNKTFIMRLHAGPFSRVRSGEKTIEIRLNDEKRKKLRVGDGIRFVNRERSDQEILVKIVGLKPFSNFTELFFGVREKFPTWNEKDFVEGMYEFYSKAQEKKFGALAIEFERVK